MAGSRGDEKQVFDVSRPGKINPDSSSRPLIISHRNILKRDPMMSGQPVPAVDIVDNQLPSGEPQSVLEPSGQPTTSKEKTITPSHTPELAPPTGVAADKAQEMPTATKHDTQDVGEGAGLEKPKDDKPPGQQEGSSASSDGAAVDAVAQRAGAQTADNKVSQQEAARREALEKLVSEKKYALPIGEKTRQRSMRRLLIVGGIAAAVLVLALIFWKMGSR